MAAVGRKLDGHEERTQLMGEEILETDSRLENAAFAPFRCQ
jgi:hypothetical protein